MKEGLSFESFAAIAKVHKDTLYEWLKVHPEFVEAKAEAWAENLLFYEKVGRAGMTGKLDGFNVTAWIFSMKNRHGWRDRQRDETDVIVNNISASVAQLTDEQLEAEFEKVVQKRLSEKEK